MDQAFAFIDDNFPCYLGSIPTDGSSSLSRSVGRPFSPSIQSDLFVFAILKLFSGNLIIGRER